MNSEKKKALRKWSLPGLAVLLLLLTGLRLLSVRRH